MAKTFRLSYNHSACPDCYTRPPKPAWLLACEATKRAKISVQYWTKIYWATPPWLDDVQRKRMKQLYLSADAAKGEHVDHIVPLRSPIVCGLHVPWNLQILNASQNYAKSNHIWPGHPYENKELFSTTPEPYQKELF